MNKQELIALAKELLNEEDLSNRSEDLKLLKREYKILMNRDDESFFDKQETDKFLAVFKELAKKEPKLLVSAYDEKKNIIANARKLLERKDVLVASKDMDKLSDEFKRAGRSSTKEQDDELWAEFREIKDQFYANKRAYFEQLDASNTLKREKKEDIIARANEVCKLDNFKEASEKMDALRKEWKEVGYSGKGDEHLWKEFLKALDEFNEKRKEHRQELVKTFEERAAKKEELIKKAKKILANSEFSDEEIASVKNLRNEYKAIGFAGKDREDDLYNRLNEVIQKYFEEMKFYKN
jgi:hypothetical protein